MGLPEPSEELMNSWVQSMYKKGLYLSRRMMKAVDETHISLG